MTKYLSMCSSIFTSGISLFLHYEICKTYKNNITNTYIHCADFTLFQFFFFLNKQKGLDKVKPCLFFLLSFFFFLFFLGPYLWHIVVLSLGVESELQLPAYTKPQAMQDLRRVCDLQIYTIAHGNAIFLAH